MLEVNSRLRCTRAYIKKGICLYDCTLARPQKPERKSHNFSVDKASHRANLRYERIKQWVKSLQQMMKE